MIQRRAYKQLKVYNNCSQYFNSTTINTTSTTNNTSKVKSPYYRLRKSTFHTSPQHHNDTSGFQRSVFRISRVTHCWTQLLLWLLISLQSTKTATSYGFHKTSVTWKNQQQQQQYNHHHHHRLAFSTLQYSNSNAHSWMWLQPYRPLSSLFLQSKTTAKLITFRRKRQVIATVAMRPFSSDHSNNKNDNETVVDTSSTTNYVQQNSNLHRYSIPYNHQNLTSTTFSTTTANEYYSLTNLQHRVAAFVQRQQQQQPHVVGPKHKICFAIAGGGGHLLSTLAATPGASSILLEGTIPYSREAFREYIKHIDIDENHETFKYCSEVAAQRLANAAYHRALHLTTTSAVLEQQTITKTNWTNVLRSPMGVASTSVLQSTIYTTTNTSDGSPVRTTRRSVESFGSRAFCAVQSSSGLQIQLHVQLAKVVAPSKTVNDDASIVPENGRTRLDEDVLVSHFLLSAIELYQYAESIDDITQILGIEPEKVPYTVNNNMDQRIIQGKTFQGDTVTVKLPPSFFERNATTYDWDNISNATATTCMAVDDPLRKAAERVLSGQDEVVMILLPQGDHRDRNSNGTTIEVMDVTMLPPQSLVVPGSFNPIHVGHIALAQAAAKAMAQPCNAIWFELSITNVDKPALAIDTIIERIKYFFPLRHEISSDLCWGILLTNAPLFKQKVDLLAPLQFNSPDSTLHFSIGTDTLVRLIDPKYYNNSEDEMLRTLMDMSCHFVVGGRLDQKKKADDVDSGDIIFIAGDEVIETLPVEIHDKFTILPDFRIDLSSTEIRKQMEAEKQSNQSS